MPLILEVSMQGYHNLRDLKAELDAIPSKEPESVLAWAKEHPTSAWAKHLAQHSARVLIEYVRQIIRVVVVLDQPAPRRVEIPVKAASLPPPRPSRLYQNVKPVQHSERRTQLVGFFKSFAPLRLVYSDVPELQNMFAEAERLRKEFNIF